MGEQVLFDVSRSQGRINSRNGVALGVLLRQTDDDLSEQCIAPFKRFHSRSVARLTPVTEMDSMTTTRTTLADTVALATYMKTELQQPRGPQPKYQKAAIELVDLIFSLPKEESPHLARARLHFENDKQRIADLICAGLESGGYASFGTCGYDKPTGTVFESSPDLNDGKPFPHIDYPMSEGGCAWLFDRQAYEDDATPHAAWVTTKKIPQKNGGGEFMAYRLDLDCLLHGMAAFIKKCPNAYADWIKENDDAITGNAFLECCVFGDVVYG